jgi:hypothetical protein
MIEANEAKLAKVKDEKERLIKAYAEGVLTLDDIAQTKVELDKEITILTEAIAALKVELNPKILSAQDIESIKEWTNRIQIGADVLLKSHPEKVRKILDLLQTHVTLESKSDRNWAIVNCILGEKALVSDVSHP